MPITKLQWWLGNQMFQYALAYSLSKSSGENIIFDPYHLENRFFLANWTFRSFELDVFWITKKYTPPSYFSSHYIHPEFTRLIKTILYWKLYLREKRGILIKNFPKNSYLDGWFQSYKYFSPYEKDIRNVFTVKTPITLKNKHLLDEILLSSNQSVSLHIRRGDYVILHSVNKWHGICSIGYYEEAITFMVNTLQKPRFYIFSDDIAWCKEHIHFPEGIMHSYIDHNGSAGHEDLRLMYSCDHHIIANSSFSWWWAYLGRNPERIVIAPKKWLQTDLFSTTDLIPPTWILL